MRTLWRGILNTILWSYERGTWQYDIAVGAIVLFLLLSPRSWFHDQPQVGPPPSVGQVERLETDPDSALQRYRVDARLVALPMRTPELEHLIHEAMSKNVSELRGRAFRIERYEALRGGDGTVVSYEVYIRP